MKKTKNLLGGHFLPKCQNQHIDVSNHHQIRNYLDYYPPMTGGNFLPKCQNQHIDVSNHHSIRNYLDYYPAMTGGNIPNHPGINDIQEIHNNNNIINIDNYARVNALNTNNVLGKLVGGRKHIKKSQKKRNKRRNKKSKKK